MYSSSIASCLLFNFLYIFIIFGSLIENCAGEGHCTKRRFFMFNYGQFFNTTLKCNEYYEWTLDEYCCYDRYDQMSNHPYCCYSETYKLLVTVGIVCAIMLSTASCVFLCWCYNIPHLILKLITCGKFNLNEYLKKSKISGPYVDPSFYGGDPFWTSEGSEYSYYPLRPMPPRIFYPLPAKVDLRRWSNVRQGNGQTPLFILASRQFTRNPYSARPHDRTSVSSAISGQHADGGNSSRRSSTSSYHDVNVHNRIVPPGFGFKVHIDEVDAASELLEALKIIDDKTEKTFTVPKDKEEAKNDMKLEELHKEQPHYVIVPSSAVNTATTQSVSSIPRSNLKDVPAGASSDEEVGISNSSTVINSTTSSQNNNVPQELDASKLILLSQQDRSASGTSFRRSHNRGPSIDSTSIAALESISEEIPLALNSNSVNAPIQQQHLGNIDPKLISRTLPGYIPEEPDYYFNSIARKNLTTA